MTIKGKWSKDELIDLPRTLKMVGTIVGDNTLLAGISHNKLNDGSLSVRVDYRYAIQPFCMGLDGSISPLRMYRECSEEDYTWLLDNIEIEEML